MSSADYYVFRHGGLYFIWHTAAAADCPPLSALSEIPHSTASSTRRPVPPTDPFSTWLRAKRTWLDRQQDAQRRRLGAQYLHTESAGFVVSSRRLLVRKHRRAYEANLDTRTFYVDGMPLFRLDRMPPPALLLSFVGRDAYGRVACAPGTPGKYRYAWKVPPPKPDAGMLREYTRLCRRRAPLDVRRVLAVQGEPTQLEAVRIRLLETLVNLTVADPEHGRLLRYLEKVPSVLDIPPPLAALLHSFVFLAAYPMAYCKVTYLVAKDVDIGDPEALLWPRRNICSMLWTHLDDEPTLHAAAAHLVQGAMKDKSAQGIIHGVILSGHHIVLLRVDCAQGGKFTHTKALPFLPSWYATSPRTEGLTALARLCFLPDADTLPKLLRLSLPSGITSARYLLPGNKGFLLAESRNLFDRLPAEILEHIRAFLPDLGAQVTYAHLCARTAAAARASFRAPSLSSTDMQFRLTRVCADAHIASASPQARMTSAAFEAVDDEGEEVEVHVGRAVGTEETLMKGVFRLLSYGCGTAWDDGCGVTLDMFVPYLVVPRYDLAGEMGMMALEGSAEEVGSQSGGA